MIRSHWPTQGAVAHVRLDLAPGVSPRILRFSSSSLGGSMDTSTTSFTAAAREHTEPIRVRHPIRPCARAKARPAEPGCVSFALVDVRW